MVDSCLAKITIYKIIRAKASFLSLDEGLLAGNMVDKVKTLKISKINTH